MQLRDKQYFSSTAMLLVTSVTAPQFEKLEYYLRLRSGLAHRIIGLGIGGTTLYPKVR